MRLRDRVRQPLIPALRWYLQSFPIHAGKRRLWRTVAPRLAHVRRTYVARTAFGAEMAGDTGDLIDQFIYYLGVWEPNLTAFLTSILRPGDVFVDVGANVGYFTLLGSSLVGPAGKVVAVEASPSIYRMLEGHVARNSLTNVRAVHCAASDEDGSLTIYRGASHNRGSTSTLPVGEIEGIVSARPLSAILAADEIGRVRAIKIDVEGAEASVVAGMGAVLREAPDDIVVIMEVTPAKAGSAGVHDILDTFMAYGFTPYRLENNYDFASLIPPRRISAPVPLTGRLTETTDVVFAREH